MVGRLYHLGRAERPASARASCWRDFDLTDAADRLVPHLLGRHAPPPRPRRERSSPGRRCCSSTSRRPASTSRSRIGLWDAIEALVADGTTVLLTTQYLDEADRLADRIAVIDHGRRDRRGHAGRAQGGGRRRPARGPPRRTPRSAEAALAALATLSDGRRSLEDGVLRVPLRQRKGAIAEAVRRLDDAGIGIDDIAVRGPTLDDVFLQLTGHAARGRRRSRSE